MSINQPWQPLNRPPFRFNQNMTALVQGHLRKRMPHQLRHSDRIASFLEQGRAEEETDTIGDQGPVNFHIWCRV